MFDNAWSQAKSHPDEELHGVMDELIDGCRVATVADRCTC